MTNFNRRKFIKTSSLGAIAASTLSVNCQNNLNQSNHDKYLGGFKADPLPSIRAAFIGLNRGGTHLRNFANLNNTEVVGLCDIYESTLKRELERLYQITDNLKNLKSYWGSKNEWIKMIDEVKPDVVFISTDWESHTPMIKQCIKKGCHVFCEVPFSLELNELWDIVNISEKYQKHCMMLENVNYGRDELMFLNMCRQGVIGELLHGEAAYIHDLRWQMDHDKTRMGSWRTDFYREKNGNIYPTHGLGPVAQYMNLCRTEDNFHKIVSYSSPALGRNQYSKENLSESNSWKNISFKNGDINSSIIKTKLGRTILVQWDETSPRPYTRLNLIQGTRGTLAGFPTRVALENGFEDITKDHHNWIENENLIRLYEKFDHPLYKKLNKKTLKSGHGGMDGIMMYRIVECLNNGLPLDQNVYEGCFWSAVAPLSKQSILDDGKPQDFPDFTRGRWKETEKLGIVS